MTTNNERASFDERTAILKAIAPYIDGAKTGDGKGTRNVFYDHAHIVGSMKGTFVNLSADEFSGAVEEGGASPDVEHHVAWVDISGPAAAVKLEFVNWSGFRFTDFFVLYKKDGEWKVSGKVFDSHAQN